MLNNQYDSSDQEIRKEYKKLKRKQKSNTN